MNLTLDEKLMIRIRFQNWLSERTPLTAEGQDLQIRCGLADRFLQGQLILIKKKPNDTEFWTSAGQFYE
mgnify:CR=1 FL=1